MKKLPIEFQEWVIRLAASSQRQLSARKLRQWVMIRWVLWADGIAENSMPGYAVCPPGAGKGYPAGWTTDNFRTLFATGSAATLLSSKGRPGCAACDRADFQLGHSTLCPKRYVR